MRQATNDLESIRIPDYRRHDHAVSRNGFTFDGTDYPAMSSVFHPLVVLTEFVAGTDLLMRTGSPRLCHNDPGVARSKSGQKHRIFCRFLRLISLLSPGSVPRLASESPNIRRNLYL
jgi:hypothetical protein